MVSNLFEGHLWRMLKQSRWTNGRVDFKIWFYLSILDSTPHPQSNHQLVNFRTWPCLLVMGHMIWRFKLMKPSNGCSKHGTKYELGEWCSKIIESYQTTTTTKCCLQNAQDVCCCDWFNTDWLVDSNNNTLLFLQYILYVSCALLRCSVSILHIINCFSNRRGFPGIML